MAAKQQKVTIKIPNDFDETDRIEIAQDMIDYIVKRSQNGIGVKKIGRGFQTAKFPGYTEEYAKKKGQKNVDLTLSEEMLSAIEILNHKRGEITIGFEAGSDVNAKAEGNQIGSYGQPKGNPAKARRFLGLTKGEIENIVDLY